MDNVIDFCAYKQFREDVAKEMEEVMIEEDVFEWLLNSDSYSPSTFTFTLESDDETKDTP